MIIEQQNGLQVYTLQSLVGLPVRHGFLSRHGGVSHAPFATLNMGAGVGDSAACVEENRRRGFAALGLARASAYDVWQVHSADVVVAEQPRGDGEQLQADAIITNQPGVVLFMRFADCVPIMLFDPVKNAIGLVHAGWQGTVKKIVMQTIRKMVMRYGSQPEQILAGIGPSICVEHYPVRDDVVNAVVGCFDHYPEDILVRRESSIHLDLWNANKNLLGKAGVKQVDIAGVCTACHPEDWFSHRAEAGKTGRFGAMIALAE